MNKINKIVAFTLAEVLLVLTIIGVVSVLVLPSISDSYKEDESIARLRKIENDLDLAYQKSVTTYGDYTTWSVTGANRVTQLTEFLKGNACGNVASTASSLQCFPPSVTIGTEKISDNTEYYKMELDDGTSVAIKPDDTNAKYLVYVALSGATGGHVIAKDIFGFNIDYANGVSPMGEGNDRNSATDAYTAAQTINATNWAFINGNMDYNKCADTLNWKTKKTCD